MELVQLHLLPADVLISDLNRAVTISHTSKGHETASEDVEGYAPPEEVDHNAITLLPLYGHFLRNCLEQRKRLRRRSTTATEDHQSKCPFLYLQDSGKVATLLVLFVANVRYSINRRKMTIQMS